MRYRIVLGMVAAAWASAASGTSLNDLSPTLRAKIECMAHVLKRERSGIDHVRFGVSDLGHWVRPYIEYRSAPEKDGSRLVVRFESRQECSLLGIDDCFTTVLPGIVRPGETVARDWGTHAVAEKWRHKCNVNVDTVHD